MKIHANPIVYEIRLYDDDVKDSQSAYDNKVVYRGSMLLQVVGKEAWISMLSGEFDKDSWDELYDFTFNQLHLEKVKWNRNGKIREVYGK